MTHDKYGLGQVISVEADTVLIIDFAFPAGTDPTSCAKLTKL